MFSANQIAEIVACTLLFREQMHGNLNFKFLLRYFDKFDPNLTFSVTQTNAMKTSYLTAVKKENRPLLIAEQQKCQNLLHSDKFYYREINKFSTQRMLR